MKNAWKYMNLTLNPAELPSARALLAEIDENGGTDAALSCLREKQYEKYGCELLWRYPISQGDSAGGFILPVREGILWLPYDEMDQDAGEILSIAGAKLLTEDDCAILRDDFRRYADALCEVLTQCAAIQRPRDCQNASLHPATRRVIS